MENFLEENEEILMVDNANYGAKGGKLYLTNKRLVFKAHSFGKPKLDIIELHNIKRNNDTVDILNHKNLLIINMSNKKQNNFVLPSKNIELWKTKLTEMVLSCSVDIEVVSDDVNIDNTIKEDILYSSNDVNVYLDRIEIYSRKGTKTIYYTDLKDVSLSFGSIITLEDTNQKFNSFPVDKEKKQEILEIIKSKIPEINSLVDKQDVEFISQNNFEVTKNFVVYRKGILIDDKSKRIIVKVYDEPLKILNYGDILNYELTVDKQAVSKASGFNTYMGRTSFWFVWCNG